MTMVGDMDGQNCSKTGTKDRLCGRGLAARQMRERERERERRKYVGNLSKNLKILFDN